MTSEGFHTPALGERGRARRWILAFAGLALSVAGLWYVFSGLEFKDLVLSMHRIRTWPLVASLATYWVGLIAVRCLLVRHLLRPVGGIGLGKACKYILVGFMANNVLPFKAGEIARSGGIARATGIRFSTVLGSLIVERLLDVVLLGLVGLVAIQVAPMPPALRSAALFSAGLFGVAFAIFVFVARRSWQERAQGSGSRIRVLVWNFWVRIMAGQRSIGTTKGAVIAVLLATVIWILALLSLQLRLASFDLPTDLDMVVVVLACIGFAAALPSTPGYLGVYHAAVVFALTTMGVDKATAAGFAVFCHLTDILPGSLLGALALTLEGMSWKDLKRSTTTMTYESPVEIEEQELPVNGVR
jgi:uncharacterized protein (TIRG00374 family)